MKPDTVQWLNDLNARFYSAVHQSFSETRTNAWPGWERLLSLPLFNKGLALDGCTTKVLDVACGNLRFEKFLNERTQNGCRAFAVDNCPLLIPSNVDVQYAELDVVDTLMNSGDDFASIIENTFGEDGSRFDLAVSFGFMHHVPSFDLRVSFLESLAGTIAEGGYVVVSLWRFLESEKLHSKALVTHDNAINYLKQQLGSVRANAIIENLEPNDWFLGWADSKDIYRYCHHFDDHEVARLAKSLSSSLELVDDFLADGKTGALNRYLVFKK